LQIQKPKQGYKLIKFLFGNYEEIPEEWERVKLIERCSKKPEYGALVSAIEKNPKLPRYIRITDLNEDGSLRDEEWKSISTDDAKNYLLNEGDVLFARTGATVGKTYLYEKKDGLCAFAGYMIRFIPKSTQLDPKFLFYYAHSALYWRWLKSIQTWGVQPNVNAEQYSNMLILLPLIKEQQKIALILSNIDSLIQQTETEIEQTQRLKKGLMKKLLTKGVGHVKFKETNLKVKFLKLSIPESWKVESLANISKIIDTPHYTSPLFDEGIVPVITTANCNITGKIDYSKVDYTSYEEYLQRTKTINPLEGDVLFTREAPLGIAVLVDKREISVGQRIILLKTDETKILNMFLVYFLNSDIGRMQSSSLSVKTTVERVNIHEIRQFRIPLPPIIEQKQIVMILSEIDSKIQTSQDYRHTLKTLKKGLMQKLLTGQIRVKI